MQKCQQQTSSAAPPCLAIKGKLWLYINNNIQLSKYLSMCARRHYPRRGRRKGRGAPARSCWVCSAWAPGAGLRAQEQGLMLIPWDGGAKSSAWIHSGKSGTSPLAWLGLFQIYTKQVELLCPAGSAVWGCRRRIIFPCRVMGGGWTNPCPLPKIQPELPEHRSEVLLNTGALASVRLNRSLTFERSFKKCLGGFLQREVFAESRWR